MNIPITSNNNTQVDQKCVAKKNNKILVLNWPWSTLCGSAGSPWRCGWGWWCCLWHWHWCDVGTGLSNTQSEQYTISNLIMWPVQLHDVNIKIMAADRRWCIRCCPRRRRLCPSAPAAAPCGWTAPGGLCGWLADPLWTPTHRKYKRTEPVLYVLLRSSLFTTGIDIDWVD